MVDIIHTKLTETRKYQLVKIYLYDINKKLRQKILESLMEETKAMASIEWWTSGSIVHKPKNETSMLLIFENNADQ